MASPCVDCNFTFSPGPEGSRVLTTAFEFLKMGRGVEQELSDSLDPMKLLQWPDVNENVNELAADCDQVVRRINAVETAIDNPAWLHLNLGLHGESTTNCTVLGEDFYMRGVLIELERAGNVFVLSADVKDRDVCRAYSYSCSWEGRLEAGDLLRTYYWADNIGTVGEIITLPGSARNHWSIRVIRRA